MLTLCLKSCLHVGRSDLTLDVAHFKVALVIKQLKLPKVTSDTSQYVKT